MNASSSLKKNRRILVIDDNRAIHTDFEKILVSTTPADDELEAAEAAIFGSATENSLEIRYELDYAFQGQDGLDRVCQALKEGRPYAMAFIDVRMPPGWDGIETTAKIWEHYPDLQVVICTAYSDYSWDEMVAKLGFSDRLLILKKPFDNIEVMQMANALTAKWQLTQDLRDRVTALERMIANQAAASSEPARLV